MAGKSHPGIYSAHAEDLWFFASRLAEGFDKKHGPQHPEARSTALSVILFSAVTIEAFLNELAFLAAQESLGDPTVQALADTLAEVEDSRGSIRLKLLMATVALGRPIDKGCEPYQSFDLLLSVRDAVVHLKPKVWHFAEKDGMEPKKLLAELHKRGLIDDPNGTPVQWFLELLASSALCSWAVQTARHIVEYLVDLLPQSFRNAAVEAIIPKMLGPDGARLA